MSAVVLGMNDMTGRWGVDGKGTVFLVAHKGSAYSIEGWLSLLKDVLNGLSDAILHISYKH